MPDALGLIGIIIMTAGLFSVYLVSQKPENEGISPLRLIFKYRWLYLLVCAGSIVMLWSIKRQLF